MQRPASRAGVALPQTVGMHAPIQAPVGMRPPTGMSQPLRPGTGMKGQPQPQQRPPTQSAISSGRPPTGMRPPTGSQVRPPTGSAGSQAGIIPVNADAINVSARPVTAQGLAGMRMGLTTGRSTGSSNSGQSTAAGPRRQVADRSYYINEVRNKLRDVVENMQHMAAQTSKLQSEQLQYTTLHTKYEVDLKSVRLLEGELADLNLAIDKASTHTNPTDLQHIQEQLRLQNSQRKKQLDDLYLQVLDYERLNKQLQQQHSTLQTNIQQKITTENEDLYVEYQQLQNELQGIKQVQEQRQNEEQHLEIQIQQLREMLDSPAYDVHKRGQHLQQLIGEKSTAIQRLQQELSLNLSSDDLKQRLTQQIKQSNQLVNTIDHSTTTTREKMEHLQETISSTENELQEAKKFYSQQHKYDPIIEKNKMITQYIETYDTQYEPTHQQLKVLQSQLIEQYKTLPAEIVNKADNPSDIDTEAQSTASTGNTLEQQVIQTQSEVEKLQAMNLRIVTEIHTLQQRISTQEEELSTFLTEEQLQHTEREKKKQLMLEIQQTKRELNIAKQQVQTISQQYDSRQKELESSEIYKQLVQIENKYKSSVGRMVEVEENVMQKKRESNYIGLREECLWLCKELNEVNVAQMKEPQQVYM